MDIQFIPTHSLKIKGKKLTLLLHPTELTEKTSADMALYVTGPFTLHTAFVTDTKLSVIGPGEYEVGGVKVTSQKQAEGLTHMFLLDGVSIYCTSVSGLTKVKDIPEANVVLVYADTVPQTSYLPLLGDSMVCLYGEQAGANATFLGKELSPVSKLAIAKDKLPTETQVILFG